MQFLFEWDENKAKQNFTKHKITFTRTSTIFLDPNAISVFNNEHSEYEDRWITLGIDETGILLVLSHTFNRINDEKVKIRIISARKATRNEINQYNKEVK